jgi:hypothetical protein
MIADGPSDPQGTSRTFDQVLGILRALCARHCDSVAATGTLRGPSPVGKGRPGSPTSTVPLPSDGAVSHGLSQIRMRGCGMRDCAVDNGRRHECVPALCRGGFPHDSKPSPDRHGESPEDAE